MQSNNEGNIILAKLESGENLFDDLREITRKYSVRSGMVVWGIGMFSRSDIGYFNGKEYEHKIIETPGEVVSFHGSISETEPTFHIHASLALPGHNVTGGHLFDATVNPLLEIEILKLNSVHINRELNSRSGLKEMKVS
ncbi:MAG: DUF296 domain-containing protein [Candidatus Thermoplasmatota archaeon]|jgi:predicted DNA-binding protein with PD1-like motif|nr:DUF296 domain-containing protein [Candidatus Thermoplasmatota archaeon]